MSISVVNAIVSAKMWWLEPYMQLIPKKKVTSVVKIQEGKKLTEPVHFSTGVGVWWLFVVIVVVLAVNKYLVEKRIEKREKNNIPKTRDAFDAS